MGNALTARLLALHPAKAMLLLGLLGAGGSGAFALVNGVPTPAIHDEFAYVLAGETFAAGRVTNPTHPLWEHFETFHVIHEPSYTSKYPPAQGLFLAAGELLGGHPAVGVWLSVGLMSAAIYWMLLGWLPRSWALLGGLLATMQLGIVGYWAQSYWGGAVAALGGALLYGSVRRIVERPRIREGVLMALGLAILANSRPFEGLLVSLPVAGMLLYVLWARRGSFARTLLLRAALPAVLVLSAAGAAMGYYNWRTTGSPTQMPYQVYDRSYGITSIFIWQAPRPAPDYRHDVIERYHREWGAARREHLVEPRFFLVNSLVKLTLLAAFFFGPAAVALVAARGTLSDPWMRLAVAVSVLVVLGSLSTATHPHYLAPATAVLVVLMTGAMRALYHREGASLRGRRVVPALVGLCVAGLALRAAVELSVPPLDFQQQRSAVIEALGARPGGDLVLVRYGREYNYHLDWVYNAAYIDHAPIIWARDMGPEKNRRLLEYYADRHVWRLDGNRDVRLSHVSGPARNSRLAAGAPAGRGETAFPAREHPSGRPEAP